MKKINLSKIVLSAIMILLIGCSDKNKEQVDNASIGQITASRLMPIATGQIVTFEVPLTKNPKFEINRVLWQSVENGIYMDEAKTSTDSKSKFTTKWLEKGSYIVSCNYEYVWGVGKKTISANYEVVVKQAHILNSFLGEDLEQVKMDNVGIKPLPENDGVYYISIDNKLYYLKFLNSKLENVQTLLKRVDPSPTFAYRFLAYELRKEKSILSKERSYEVSYKDGYKPTKEVAEAVAEFEKGTNLNKTDHVNVINAAIKRGDIESLSVATTIIDDDSVERMIFLKKDEKVDNGYMIVTITKKKVI